MSTAQESESPVGAGLVAEQNTGTDSIVGNADAERKRFATLQARAAIAGVVLRRFESNEGAMVYHLSRWALSRELLSLDDVDAWLARVIGPQPHADSGRRERDRRATIDAANRQQDRLDEAADRLRGPGGER